MSQVTISVPHLTLSDRVTVILVVAAILTSIVIEIYSRHYTKKQIVKFGEDAEKLGKAWTALLLTAVGALFTGLGYLIVLAPSYTSYLTTLPFIGKHVMAVVGIATTLYMIRGKVWFQKFANRAAKWSGGKSPAVSTSTDPATPQPPVAPSDELSV